MKIHYKTILLNEEGLVNEQVIEKRRKRQIEYCCKEIEKAIEIQVISVTCKDLFLQESEYHGNYLEDWAYHPLKFCPFCGERIEHIEEYKARNVMHKVHVPAKTTPARTEARYKEVKI